MVIGVLLRRRGRGRAFLLVLSGFLIVPYALGIGLALASGKGERAAARDEESTPTVP